jgi:hypothetical protein
MPVDVIVKWLARILVTALLPWALWRMQGAVGLVFSAPVLGAMWASPIVEGLAFLWRAARRQSVADLEGCHYAWRGRSLRITEDELGDCWIASSQVRRLGFELPADLLLQARLSDEAWLPADGHRPGIRLRVDVLADNLVQSSSAPAVRFARWLRSEVMAPARRRRQLT